MTIISASRFASSCISFKSASLVKQDAFVCLWLFMWVWILFESFCENPQELHENGVRLECRYKCSLSFRTVGNPASHFKHLSFFSPCLDAIRYGQWPIFLFSNSNCKIESSKVSKVKVRNKIDDLPRWQHYSLFVPSGDFVVFLGSFKCL